MVGKGEHLVSCRKPRAVARQVVSERTTTTVLFLWVKSGELNDDYIENTGEHISELGPRRILLRNGFSPRTLLIALYGATVGKTSILAC